MNDIYALKRTVKLISHFQHNRTARHSLHCYRNAYYLISYMWTGIIYVHISTRIYAFVYPLHCIIKMKYNTYYLPANAK